MTVGVVCACVHVGEPACQCRHAGECMHGLFDGSAYKSRGIHDRKYATVVHWANSMRGHEGVARYHTSGVVHVSQALR